MKFSLAKEHRDFFNTHRAIELEGLLSHTQVAALGLSVATVFKKNLRLSDKGLELVQPTKLFAGGHDLWRENESIKKIIFHRQFAQMAVELGYKGPIRIGFDQFIRPPLSSIGSLSLLQMSSLQGTLCGFLICLKGHDEEAEDYNVKKIFIDRKGETEENQEKIQEEFERETTKFNPFASTAGNVTFIDASFVIDFARLPPLSEYLLVTYTIDKAVYSFNMSDHHTHFLKKFGYGFGDRIKEATHPTIYREHHRPH